MVDQLLHRHAFVLDEVLLVQTILFVKLFHLAADDLLDHRFRLARRLRLFLVNLAFAVQRLLRHFIPAQKTRIERGDVHRHVVAQPLKFIGTRHEVALAIHFDQYADFPAGVNVRTHQAFGGRALRLLGRRRLSLLPQNVDGLFDVAAAFHQRFTASGESRAGPVPQLLYLLRRYV